MKQTLLVIEDDHSIRRGVVDALEFHGYEVLSASDGRQGLELALRANYHLLLLDLVLPGLDGFSILQELKKQRPGQAVIVLSARGEENDRVKGLGLGADDYVMKPFSVRELLARVAAVLRRTCERKSLDDFLEMKCGTVDFSESCITYHDASRCDFSEREISLLKYFSQNPERVVTREEILRSVWQLDPKFTETRTLDMHIMHLRTKLKDNEQNLLATVRGKGWRFHPIK